METQDREILRQEMDRTKQLEYLSSVEMERNRVTAQIEQLRRQIGSLTQKKIDLDKEWREGILSVHATPCKPVLKPSTGKKLDPRKKNINSALKNASSEKLAKIADLLQKAGFEI